jgi:hypothetical protein
VQHESSQFIKIALAIHEPNVPALDEHPSLGVGARYTVGNGRIAPFDRHAIATAFDPATFDQRSTTILVNLNACSCHVLDEDLKNDVLTIWFGKTVTTGLGS